MRGLLLTGPTGVGKSTAQLVLHQQYGFWTPRTCTTRQVEAHESDFLHHSELDFLKAVRDSSIVLPASFGGEWYGWPAQDLHTLQHGSGRAVLNVRPYPALILQALLEDFTAVWLTVDDEELNRRRAGRLAVRDTNLQLRKERQTQDEADLVYRSCFGHVCTADDALVANLLALVP